MIAQPTNLATPAVAASGFAVHVIAAPVGDPARARVTREVSVVTTLPTASSIETTGWTANGVPPVAELLGSVVKTSLLAGPSTTKALLKPAMSTVSIAPITSPDPVLGSLMTQSVNVATPLALAISVSAVHVSVLPAARS